VYSVKLRSGTTGKICYLTFETFGSAVNCIETLNATEEGRYTPDDYFEAGRLNYSPQGEVLNERAIETDHVVSYKFKLLQ
jgi:hypothetical protein